MLQFALLAMQAAGMVVDWYSTKQQIAMGRMGAKLEQAGISANIEMTRAQTEEATTRAMQNLRQTMGSQIAMQAARGNAMVGGTTLSLLNENVSNFGQDERVRRMNLLSREAELKAQSVMSGLHQDTYENQQWQAYRQRVFDKIPTDPKALKTLGANLSSEWSGSKGVARNGSNGGSYGMTPV